MTQILYVPPKRIFSALPPYLGGKRRLISPIFSALSAIADPTEWSDLRFLDPMCGGGSVALAAKWLGFKTIASDASVGSHVVAKALISNSNSELIQSDISMLCGSISGIAPGQPGFAFALKALRRMIKRADRRPEPVRSLLHLALMSSYLRLFPMSLPSATDVKYALNEDWDKISSRRLNRYATAPQNVGSKSLWGTAKQINAGVFGGAGWSLRGDARDVLGNVNSDIAYLDPPYPGTKGYQDNYRNLDEFLGESSSSLPTPDIDQLLDAAKYVPVTVISLGGPSIDLETLKKTVGRHRSVVKAIKVPYTHLPSLSKRQGASNEFIVVAKR